MAFQTKLTELHRSYILKCLASFLTSPTQIRNNLENPDIAESIGFEPVKVTTARISQVIIRYKRDPEIGKELETMRASYLLDFSDLPLYHQKQRVIILEARFHAIRGLKSDKSHVADIPPMKDAKGNPLSDRVMLDLELKILRQISEEAGENLEKIARALASGHSIKLNLTLSDRILGHYKAPDDPQ